MNEKKNGRDKGKGSSPKKESLTSRSQRKNQSNDRYPQDQQLNFNGEYDLSEIVVMQRIQIERLLREKNRVSQMQKERNQKQIERRVAQFKQKQIEFEDIIKEQKKLLDQKGKQLKKMQKQLSDISQQNRNSCNKLRLVQSHVETTLDAQGQKIKFLELQLQIEQLQKRNAKLSQQLMSYRQKVHVNAVNNQYVDDCKTELIRLETFAKFKAGEVDQLNKKNTQTQQFYTKQVQRFTNENTKLQQRINDTLKQNEKLGQIIFEKDGQIGQLVNKINQMVSKLQQNNIKIQELEKDNNRISSLNQQLEQNLRFKMDQLQQLRSFISKLQSQSLSFKQKIGDIQFELSQKEHKIDLLTQNYENIQKQIYENCEMAEKFSEVIQHNVQLTSQVQQLQSFCHDKQSELLSERQKVKDHQRRIQECEDDIDYLQKNTNIQNQELTLLKKQREEFHSQISRLKKYEYIFPQMKNTMNTFVQQINRYENVLSKYQNRIHELEGICISSKKHFQLLLKNGHFPPSFINEFTQMKQSLYSQFSLIQQLSANQNQQQKYCQFVMQVVQQALSDVHNRYQEWNRVYKDIDSLSSNLRLIQVLQQQNKSLKLKLLQFQSQKKDDPIQLKIGYQTAESSQKSGENWLSRFDRERQVGIDGNFLSAQKQNKKKFLLASSNIPKNHPSQFSQITFASKEIDKIADSNLARTGPSTGNFWPQQKKPKYQSTPFTLRTSKS